MTEKRNSGRTGRRRMTPAEVAQRGPKAMANYRWRYGVKVLQGGQVEQESRAATSTQADLVEPPDWLPEGQLPGWRYITENAEPGALKQLDRGLLVAWCGAEERFRQAETALQDPELPKGADVLYRRISDRSAKLMLSLGDRLGFSPRARVR